MEARSIQLSVQMQAIFSTLHSSSTVRNASPPLYAAPSAPHVDEERRGARDVDTPASGSMARLIQGMMALEGSSVKVSEPDESGESSASDVCSAVDEQQLDDEPTDAPADEPTDAQADAPHSLISSRTTSALQRAEEQLRL